MASALHNAARSGNLVALTGAIAEGANLDVRDQHSRTPLILAAWAGHINCVKALIAGGAKVNLGAQDDMNALHFAVQKGNTECVRWLLEEGGAKINSKNSRTGSSPLMMAAQHRHKDLVELLLKKKADPLAKNKQGKTAREMCDEADEDIISMLEAAEEKRAEALAEEAKKRKERNDSRLVATPRETEKATVAGPALAPQIGSQAPQEETISEQPVSKKPKVMLNYDEDD